MVLTKLIVPIGIVVDHPKCRDNELTDIFIKLIFLIIYISR